ncbi:MAG: hypothetical protein A2W86_09480 [Bacteroidetes bacterium GWD2_45_23]|nr:MAG: hypothetical protein A2W87_06045 [Bacteroidetes bacterium GWC2_46_850]OFX79051.1 MAG: hypothetical protein A2071_10040 [Bacteroidetes bacterium GWC1_47_7]OFX83668.1 MAG: hypothetical protein A2W86_09480 [Bacteroidetes bacterium GWD2_45_23]HAR39093.1 hypothetical protein [Porphyromonadaceae bacterium]HBA99552.1 hypothetical protein [Porphyromonadaceae bacterium]
MQEKSQKKSARLHSLDALRGFDMLWIAGGQKIVYALATMTGWPLFEWLNKLNRSSCDRQVI